MVLNVVASGSINHLDRSIEREREREREREKRDIFLKFVFMIERENVFILTIL